MTDYRDRPFYRLTAHFFAGLFDFGFLSDKGAQSFTRLVLGVTAVFLAIGLLLLRIYMSKYRVLANADTSDPFRVAALGDHAFLVAVPMWVVAFVITLVGHAVFPDETDFRVLMALPVTRQFVFGAKLLALVLFGGLFVVASHVALVPLVLLTSMGPWLEPSLPLRLAGFWTASLAASVTAALAIVASQGLLMIGVPRARLAAASAGLRSLLLFFLIMSLPFLFRLPQLGESLLDGSRWVLAIPPAWFIGVERGLLGDDLPYLTSLARLAGASAIAATAVTIASYALLYRGFDRTVLRSTSGEAPASAAIVARRPRRSRRPILAAVRAFVRITLRRSVMHQGIVVALSAVGAGLVVNSLLAADVVGWLGQGAPGRRLVEAVYWAPFPLMFVSTLAVRTALLVPVEERANWIFRIIEQGAGRVDELAAAPGAVFVVGALFPALVLLPLQWLVAGSGALMACAVAIILGWLRVELLMKDWDRIPFTCSFIPGKGFLPQTILFGVFSFSLFTTFGWALAQSGAAGSSVAVAMTAAVAAGAFGLRRRRRRAWAHTPLAFEDYVPSELNPLRLSSD